VVAFAKVIEAGFGIPFFAGELVAATYSLVRTRRCLLANKFPAQGFADFDAANVPQRCGNTPPESSLDGDLEGPQVQA
jgi:hypothetical protein